MNIIICAPASRAVSWTDCKSFFVTEFPSFVESSKTRMSRTLFRVLSLFRMVMPDSPPADSAASILKCLLDLA